MTRRRIPGLAQESERALLAIVAELEAKIATLGAVSAQRGVVAADFLARPGELLAIEAPTAGISCALPAPNALDRDARVTLVLRNSNPVRVSCSDGEVNGEELVTYTAAGVVELVSDGSGWYGWHTSMVTDLPLAAHASLDQARVLGRASGAGAGAVTALTGQQLAAIVQASDFAWTGEHVHAERAVGPTVASGQGAFWFEDTAPSGPIYTDDAGGQWRMGFACVSVNTTIPTATNAATNLSCGGSYTVPALTWRQGTLYRFTGIAVYDHAAAATPTITAELLINGVVVTTLVMTPMNLARVFDLHLIGYIRCQSTGAGGTVMCSIVQVNSFAVQGAGISSHDHVIGERGTATTAINTTASRAIEMRVRMTTAVASNTLTVTQGFIERLA